MKWERVNLGDIAEFKNGLNFSNDQYGKGVKYISVADFKDYFSAKTESLAELKEDFINPSYYLQAGDILFVRSNGNKELVGRNLFIQDSTEPLTFSGFCIRARFTKDDILPKFYAYLFKSKFFRNTLSASAGGTNINNLNQGILSNLNIPKPPIPTQHRITSILSAYDDLIENNLKRIKLLEEKAFWGYKAIIKNERVEEKKINQVTQFLKRGISPKYVNEDGVIVLNQKCNRNHIVSFEDSRLTDSEKNIPEERMLQKFDTLINSTGTGTLGRIAMNIQDEFPLTADSHITIVRANHEITPIYLCMSLFAMENVIEMMGEGATNQTELSPKKVGEEIKIPLVSNTLMNEYEKQAVPIFNLIWNLQKQNAKLREARDILLPRLMNREIVV